MSTEASDVGTLLSLCARLIDGVIVIVTPHQAPAREETTCAPLNTSLPSWLPTSPLQGVSMRSTLAPETRASREGLSAGSSPNLRVKASATSTSSPTVGIPEAHLGNPGWGSVDVTAIDCHDNTSLDRRCQEPPITGTQPETRVGGLGRQSIPRYLDWNCCRVWTEHRGHEGTVALNDRAPVATGVGEICGLPSVRQSNSQPLG